MTPILDGNKPDVRTDLLSREEFDRNCMHYADWAFYTPPEQFLFHHYDEDPSKILICHRPMVGMEKYVCEGVNGGFYGIYDTRDVTWYIKSGSWVIVESKDVFIKRDILELERQLREKKKALEDLA